MSEIDKMARELLSSECPECGGDGGFEFNDGDWRNCGRCDDVHTVPRSQAESAIRAALLTAPQGWRLVPIPPTDDMIDAAQDAHMPFGDMHFAITSAILAAPEPK